MPGKNPIVSNLFQADKFRIFTHWTNLYKTFRLRFIASFLPILIENAPNYDWIEFEHKEIVHCMHNQRSQRRSQLFG